MIAIARNTHEIEELVQTAAGMPTIFDFVIWKNLSHVFCGECAGAVLSNITSSHLLPYKLFYLCY